MSVSRNIQQQHAGKQNRIFTIIKGVTVTIKYLTLRNGTTNTNGSAIVNNGILTVGNSTFKGNSAHNIGLADYRGNGGAIRSTGTLTVKSSIFTGNSAHNVNFGHDNGNGGAISQYRDIDCVATITARPGGSYIVTVSILYDSCGNYHDQDWVMCWMGYL